MNLSEIPQHWLVLRLGWTLLHFLWQGAICGMLAWLLLALLRRSSPARRYAALLGVLGVMALSPVCTMALLREPGSPELTTPTLASRRTGELELPNTRVGDTFGGMVARDDAQRLVEVQPPINTEPVLPTERSSGHWGAWTSVLLPWTVFAWCCGVTALTLRMLGGWWSVCQMTKQAVPLPATYDAAVSRIATSLGVRRTVRYFESALTSVPLTVGWLRPLIVLPASLLTNLTPQEVECLIAHEVAHIRRHDYLVNLLQCAIEILLFYHPAVHWISARIRQEREQACDRLAVGATGDRLVYSRALLHVAELSSAPSLLALAASGGELKERIQALLGGPGIRFRRSGGVAGICITLVFGTAGYMLLTSPGTDQITAKDSPAKSRTLGGHTEKDIFRLLPVSGGVFDPKGNPVAGARVYMRETSRGFSSVSERPPAIKDLAEAVTDAAGRFAFSEVFAEQDDLRLDVVAVADKYALAWKHLPGGVAHTRVRLVLEPESQLGGRILNAAGQPVSDAEVSLQYTMSIRHVTQADLEEGRWPRSDDARFASLHGFTAPPRARTDAAGRFLLSGLPTGLGLVLKVSHPRYALQDCFAATVANIDPENASRAKRDVQTNEVNVSLRRARSLTVQVVFEDTGEPAAGAGYTDVLNFIVGPAAFKTGPDGRFTVHHLDRREVQLNVYPPDGSDYLTVGETVLFSENEFEKTHTIELPRGAVVTGRVVDRESGEGIAKVPVWALQARARGNSTSWARTEPATTRSDGTFRLAVVPGEVTVAVHGRVPGYRTPQSYGTISAERAEIAYQVIAAIGNPTKGVQIKLQRAPIVEGTVYDSEGQASPGVSITGRIQESPNGYRTFGAISDESGHFVLNQLGLGTDNEFAPRATQVLFRDRQRNLGAQLLLDAPIDRDLTVDVELRPLGTVTGRLINGDTREPISGARVAIYKETSPHSRSWGIASPTLRSQADGRFVLTGVFEGAEYFLAVTDGRFRRTNGLDLRFAGRYGEQHDFGDVLLFPPVPPEDQQVSQVEAPSIDGLTGQAAFELLSESYRKDYAAYRELLDKTTTGRQRDHIVRRREPTPVYAEVFKELAERHRDTDAELKALVWIVDCRIIGGSEKRVIGLKPPAAERLIEAYLDRAELAGCVKTLLINGAGRPYAKNRALELARRLLRENPHREVQAWTCYEMAQLIGFPHHSQPNADDRKAAIEFLEQVVNEFADVPHWRHGTLGAGAKRGLFELQRLVVGNPAPETTGLDLLGQPLSLSDFRGKVVVLNFWGSWCGPCIFELPELKRLADEFGDRLAVVGVMSDSADEARKAIEKHDVRFPNFIDGATRDGGIVKLWNVDSWPTTYVLDEEGVIRHKSVQAPSLRDKVWQLLKD